MSVASTRMSVFHASSGSPRARSPEPLAVRILEVVVLATAGTVLCLASWTSWEEIQPLLPELALWMALVMLTDLMPVPLGGTLLLSLSLPLLLAAGMMYAPAVPGLLAFFGSSDPREIRKEVSLLHGLHNRSQIALSSMAASAIFHAFDVEVVHFPLAVWAGLLALLADFAVNITMVLAAAHLAGHIPLRRILRYVDDGSPIDFMLGYACFGLMALLMAIVFNATGISGLLVFLIPVFLARQMFVRGRLLQQALLVVSDKTRALLEITERIGEERRDERLGIAAELHDEVLPPLYKVHLMGQVLRHDLAGGRLLALEDDVPDLVRATEVASDAVRGRIRDLRRSAQGLTGLPDALRLLVRHLQEECSLRISAIIEEVEGSHLIQLLAYQIAREALRNAIRHADASQVALHVSADGSEMEVVIEDDGRGFDPASVDNESHFGLQLMRERAELAGGSLRIEAISAGGTRVVARLPVSPA